MFNLLHTFHPQPIAFELGALTFRWYGIFLVLGALAGIFLSVKVAEHYAIHRELVYGFATSAIVFGLIGARIYYVIYGWDYYSVHPEDIIKIWQGGLAIYGAMIGGFLAIYFFCRRHGYKIWHWLDSLVPGLVAGQILGRFGNYFNQELFGKPTSLPWGIPIDPANRPSGFESFQYFHPTFLYEALLNLILLIALILLHRINLKRKKQFKPGIITLAYLIGYSLIRIFTESLRTDFTPFVFGLRWQMLASIIVLLIAAISLFWKLFDKRN